jgi:uncharacterized damage-inducible protein DinB
LLESLAGVDAVLAARAPGQGRNSIWELVQHLTHGRHLLIERLTESHFDYPSAVREPWWPVASEDTSEAAWRSELRRLDEYHSRLVNAIRAATDAQLARVPSAGDQTLAQQLLGMAIHDAYHAGQIRLLALIATDTR